MKFLLLLLMLNGSPAMAQDFLDAHTGTYKGTLYLLYPNGKQDSVTMEMILEASGQAGRWQHTTRYLGDNGAIGQVKDYQLVVDSTVSDGAHYILDEKDGILITEIRVNKTFYAHYIVDDMSYHVVTSYENSFIDYELSCYSLAAIRNSESEPDEENKTWKVDSYSLMTVQKGRLIKQ